MSTADGRSVQRIRAAVTASRRRRLAVYETPFVVTHDSALFAPDQGIRGAERYPGIGVPVL